MSVAFLFPGQGSQRPGMLHDLPDRPAARDMISRATGVLVEEGCEPDYVVGHSVGAFTAAVVAGALAYPDALRLVDLRARAMQEAYPRGYGMGVVVGLDERTVSRLATASGTPKVPVHASNVNAPLQVSVSGADGALEQVLAL